MALIEEIKDDFLRYLAEYVVTFVYEKIDGTKRRATGTRNLGLIPSESHPKGKPHWEKECYIRYYDTVKEGWRTLRIDHLKSIMIEDWE